MLTLVIAGLTAVLDQIERSRSRRNSFWRQSNQNEHHPFKCHQQGNTRHG